MSTLCALNGLLFLSNFVQSQNLPGTYPASTSVVLTTTMDTTTTASECDAFTPVPDYSSQCNTTNSFTLTNGRFVDKFWKFCGCALEALTARKMTCQGFSDFPVPKCNADGTFNCRGQVLDLAVCTNNRGGKGNYTAIVSHQIENPYPNCDQEAYCQSACIRYSKEMNQFQNVGGCRCPLAQSQEMDSTLSPNDNYVPQCNVDGSWQRRQTGFGGSWCVDPSGNPTGDISSGSLYAANC